jgi:DNA-binding SARP family transcriptional activator
VIDGEGGRSRELTIALCGGFHVTRAGEFVSFATDRARALLAYLAVEVGHAHRREALAALFWPEAPERLARQNLSQTLTRLRQAIDDFHADPAFLQITRPTIQLNRSAPISVDLLDLQQILKVCSGWRQPSSYMAVLFWMVPSWPKVLSLRSGCF